MLNGVVPLEVDVPCLFQAPQRVTALVNRDVLITMSCPEKKMVGAYLFTEGHHLAELGSGLDMLLKKMTTSLKVSAQDIQVRALGLSSPNPIVTQAFKRWCEQSKVTVVAEDLGRNVQRNVIIDCETGKVGVAYAESTPLERTFLIAEGTASERDPGRLRKRSCLILGESRTHRLLCRQAVESVSGWSATAMERPFDFFVAPKWNEFHYDAVIFLADLGDGKPVQKWLTQLAEKHPSAKRIWVGDYPSQWDTLAETFPAFEPQSSGAFQAKLKETLIESDTNPGAKVFRLNP